MLRFPSTYEPPAEEADEAPDDNNDGDGDACYGARAEVGPAIASSAIPHEVAEDHRVRRTGKSSRAPAHICAGSTSSTAARRCTRARRSALECLLRRYVYAYLYAHITWRAEQPWQGTGLWAEWLADTAHREGACLEVTEWHSTVQKWLVKD